MERTALIHWALVERTACHSGEDGFDTLHEEDIGSQWRGLF